MSHPPTTELPRYVQIVIVSHGRWTFLGRRFGPREEFAVEVSYDPDVGFRYQRCDGRPLKKVGAAIKLKLELAQVAVMREFKAKRSDETVRLRRSSTTERTTLSQAATPETVGQPPLSPESPRPRPTGSFLKPNREVPTDRQRPSLQTRLVPSAPSAPKPESAPTPAIDALADEPFADELLPEKISVAQDPPSARPITATRERVLTPFRTGLDEHADTLPVVSKTTSSIFRVDRQTTTDRIAKLRKSPSQVMPPEADPFAVDHADDLKPLMDELTTRMRRRRTD